MTKHEEALKLAEAGPKYNLLIGLINMPTKLEKGEASYTVSELNAII